MVRLPVVHDNVGKLCAQSSQNPGKASPLSILQRLIPCKDVVVPGKTNTSTLLKECSHDLDEVVLHLCRCQRERIGAPSHPVLPHLLELHRRVSISQKANTLAWVLKGFSLSYHTKETILFSVDPYYFLRDLV